jgi:hypothetical protein
MKAFFPARHGSYTKDQTRFKSSVFFRNVASLVRVTALRPKPSTVRKLENHSLSTPSHFQPQSFSNPSKKAVPRGVRKNHASVLAKANFFLIESLEAQIRS